MAILVDASRWVEKQERRLRAAGVSSPKADGLRLAQPDVRGLRRRIGVLYRQVERLRSTRPRELARRLELADALAVAAREYVAAKGTDRHVLGLALERAFRAYDKVARG